MSDDTQNKNLIPSIGDRYEVLDLLGRGGMGEVLRVFDRQKQADVACKVLHEKLAGAKETARFSAEFKITSRLNHPNIISVYDFGFSESGSPYYTMELIEGKTLEQVSKTMSFKALFSAIFEVCLALDRIHQAGLIHNDVKDRNVMIHESGSAILMDLGLVCTGRTQTEHFKGTIGYAAPELIRGEAYDHRSDLYSLGVLIYHCLSGRLPVASETIAGILMAQTSGQTIPLISVCPGIPLSISEIIERMLSVDPLKRFHSAVEVIGAFSRCAETGLEERASHLPPEYGLPEEFVGRENILSELHSRVFTQPESPVQLLVFKGPKGIGKSRLAREFRIRAQVEGGRYLQSEIQEFGASPLKPVEQLLDAALTEESANASAVIKKHATHLSYLFPGRFEFAAAESNTQQMTEPEVRRDRFLGSLAEAFQELITDRPTVLFLDNFQWADQGTLRWIAKLKDYASTQSQLLILLALSEPEWSDRIEEDLQMSDFSVSIPEKQLHIIPPLNEDETKSFLEKCFARTEDIDLLAQRIYLETGGNPQFLEVVIRDLIERQIIRREHFFWYFDLAGLADLPVAAGIRDIFERRLSNLDAKDRTALQILSIFPRNVSLETFEMVSGLSTYDALNRLRKLVKIELIEEKRKGTSLHYRFKQIQVRNIVYQDVRAVNLRKMHLKAADAILEIDKMHHAALAYHFERGGHIRHALTHSFRAGQHASSVFSFEDAILYFEKCLAFALSLKKQKSEDDGSKFVYASFAHLANCHQEIGQWEQAEKVLKRHLAYARKYGSLRDQIPVLGNLGFILMDSGQPKRASVHYTKALSFLQEIKSPTPFLKRVGIQLLINSAHVALTQAQLAQAKLLFESVSKQAESIQDTYLIAVSASNLAVCNKNMGSDGLDHERICARIAKKHGYEDIQIRLKVERALDEVNKSHLGRSLEIIDDVVAQADKIGSYRLRLMSRIHAVRLHAMAGNLIRAQDILSEIDHISQDLNISRVKQGRYQHARAWLELATGQPERSVESLLAGMEKDEREQRRLVCILLAPDLIDWLISVERFGEADQWFKKYNRLYKKMGFKACEPNYLYIQALLWLRSGQPEKALQNITRVQKYIPASRSSLQGLRFRALKAEALLHNKLRKRDAISTINSVLSKLDDRGFRYFSAVTRIQWLTAYLNLPGVPDSHEMSRVGEMLSNLIAISEDMGVERFLLAGNRLKIQLGERAGDPETIYKAKRHITALLEKTEVGRLEPMREAAPRVSDRVDLMDSSKKLPQAWRKRLSRDAGGKYLLKLLELLK